MTKLRGMMMMLVALVASLGVSAVAFASDAAGAVAGGASLTGVGAAIALGIAALGGALGQARVAAAALEGIGRNPAAAGKVFVPMIIGLALIESLVLYAFVIAIMKA